eukprot:scaffold6501_cov116-Isochrysis_galbana.AAC.2
MVGLLHVVAEGVEERAKVHVALVFPSPAEQGRRILEPRLAQRSRAQVGAVQVLALAEGRADEADGPRLLELLERGQRRPHRLRQPAAGLQCGQCRVERLVRLQQRDVQRVAHAVAPRPEGVKLAREGLELGQFGGHRLPPRRHQLLRRHPVAVLVALLT